MIFVGSPPTTVNCSAPATPSPERELTLLLERLTLDLPATPKITAAEAAKAKTV
jgi:hypothetical protein